MTAATPFHWRPSRRAFSTLVLAAPLFARARQERKVQTTSDGEPHFVDPPGEPTAALAQRIAELGIALAAGRATTNAILSGPTSNELRPYTAFRELIARHAPTGRAVLAPEGEPGLALLARVRVLDSAGLPCPDARVYAYQTCAKGWYAAEAPHVSGNAGDFRWARLFTHARTDADGSCELVTIHPAGYPRSELPSHIHLLLAGPAGEERVTEIRFEDCPRMTPSERESSLRAGFAVVPVERLSVGSARCTAEFALPPA